MKRFILAALPAVLLAACGTDDVPKVEDPHHIVVGGEQVTQAKFLETYCTGKPSHETCLRVQQAMRADATKGAPPRF